MTINEVFKNPTVKQVIFQIRFPNLFFLESRIGDFQINIMKDFPVSSLTLERQVMLTDLSTAQEAIKNQEDRMPEYKKRWSFQSPSGVTLNVEASSLALTSNVHKTYNNPSVDNRFRDLIKKSVDAFISIAPIPIFSRIGLRYVDECPVPAAENTQYSSYYNTSLALNKYSLSETIEMSHIVRTKKDGHFLYVAESFSNKEGITKLTFDFDAYDGNIEPSKYLTITDELHTIISEEYERTIKQPVIDYMRR